MPDQLWERQIFFLLTILLQRRSARSRLQKLLELECQTPWNQSVYQQEIALWVKDLNSGRKAQALQTVLYKRISHAMGSRLNADETLQSALSEILGSATVLAMLLQEMADGAVKIANLTAYLVRRVHWKARDIQGSEIIRHSKRTCDLENAPLQVTESRRMTDQVVVAQIMRRFGPSYGALLTQLRQGQTISEAARTLGVSRQHVYRALRQVRLWASEGVTP